MTLDELGWNPELAAAFATIAKTVPDDAVVGRVMADFGKDLRVAGDFGDERAALSGRLRFEEGLRPAVGDFVVMVGVPESYVIVEIVPRRTYLARQAAGQKTGIQLIGANLDVVFVVTSFNEDLNINRLERYLVAIREGGAEGVVVVNKSDLVDPADRDSVVADLGARLNAVVRPVSAKTDDGLDGLGEWLAPGKTASFVGSSGVGKSSILNRLLGDEAQRVEQTRNDDKGRHTTTHRELFVLPGSGLLLDTPGMREFQLWDEVVDDAFGDIAALALACRFRDCGHGGEPGCAVGAAVEQGELSEARLESWRKLDHEAKSQALRQEEAARRAESRKTGRMHKEIQKRKRRDD